MKIIITGGSGFIGSEVIRSCLAHNSITSVIALCRRPLPEPFASDPKVKTIIMKDWTKYDNEVLKECAGAGACIWSLGITPANPDMNNLDRAREVSIDYTMRAAEAFEEHLAPQLSTGTPFRFAYVSGAMVSRDQTAKYWFAAEPRRIRGQVETVLSEFAQQKKQHKQEASTFQLMIARPGFVLGKSMFASALSFLPGMPSVQVKVCANTLVDFALEGSAKETWENDDLAKGLAAFRA